MTAEAKAALVSAAFSVIAGIVLILQYCSTQRELRYEREQIQYLGVLSREDRADKFGTLRLMQVSGEPYLIDEVSLTPSVPDEFGGFVSGMTIDISLLPYLDRGRQLPEFVIHNVGELICHKILKMENEPCDPTARFSIRYQYDVFGDKRRDKEALIGPEY